MRHLYVHLPFCVHRCGYCDFVTAVGRVDEHGAYADAVLRELDRERPLLAPRLATVFVGGGTPTFTEPAALARVLAALPEADEVTVEANPETVTAELAVAPRRPRRHPRLARRAVVPAASARGAGAPGDARGRPARGADSA